MSRQVDIKALVSHIVRGDGSDRCRICMGDTTEGQVHLEDTVMMDGDKPVTLSELLEVITGVEMEIDPALPCGLCRRCSDDAIAAYTFRSLCAQSAHHWREGTTTLSDIYPPTQEDKAYFIFYQKENTVIKDQIARVPTLKDAIDRLNDGFVTRKPEKKKRAKYSHGHQTACKCPDCGKKFSKPYFLNHHFRNTLNRVCTHCCAIIPKKRLAKHLEAHHNFIVSECSFCHKLFKEEQNMLEHVNEYHGPNTHNCNVCGNGYTSERALKSHAHAHSLFHCSSCTLSYENIKCYKYHQKVCKGNGRQPVEFQSFTCHDCGVTYDRKPSLRIHIVQKHLNVLPYTCQICGKRTSTLAHLKSHESIHKTERKIFQCYCGAKLRTELGFQLHLRIHTGERPYECGHCGDRFLSSSRRLDHIKRRHQGAKDFKHGCKECSARFVRPCELKKHYMTVHYLSVEVKPAKREIVNPLTRRIRNTLPKIK